jgi:hypothetical protein
VRHQLEAALTLVPTFKIAKGTVCDPANGIDGGAMDLGGIQVACK